MHRVRMICCMSDDSPRNRNSRWLSSAADNSPVTICPSETVLSEVPAFSIGIRAGDKQNTVTGRNRGMMHHRWIRISINRLWIWDNKYTSLPPYRVRCGKSFSCRKMMEFLVLDKRKRTEVHTRTRKIVKKSNIGRAPRLRVSPRQAGQGVFKEICRKLLIRRGGAPVGTAEGCGEDLSLLLRRRSSQIIEKE